MVYQDFFFFAMIHTQLQNVDHNNVHLLYGNGRRKHYKISRFAPQPEVN